MSSGPAGVEGEREFRKRLYRSLGVEGAGGRRVPAASRAASWQRGLYLEGAEPVYQLALAIRSAGPQSVQVVAGARGTGLAQGLRALADELDPAGGLVVEVDLARVLPHQVPPSGLEVQVALHLLLDEAMHAQLPELAAAGLEAGARIARLLPRGGGRSQPFEAGRVRALLGTAPTGGSRLANALAGQEAEARARLLERFDDLLEALRRLRGPEARLVVVVQGLGRLGQPGAEGVLNPGRAPRLFLAHGGVLALPEAHVVVAAPAELWWARTTLEATLTACRVHWWPAVPAPDGEVLDTLISLVAGPEDATRLLPERAAWEELARASGGHLARFEELVRECVLEYAEDQPGTVRVARVLRQARSRTRASVDAPRRKALQRLRALGVLPFDAQGIPTRPALDLMDQGLVLGHLDMLGRPSFSTSPLAPAEEP